MKRLALLAAAALASAPAFGQGILIPTEPGLRPLELKYQRVAAEITDGAAVTKVEQVFLNHTPRPLEATYVFPLPKGAALSDFALWISGVKTKGEMLEKQKATEIYEGIVRRLQDPGLLEYIDNDLFRARVFPVPPSGEQKIEIAFSQVLDFQSGLYRYRYPLGATSRSVPGATQAAWNEEVRFRCPPGARCGPPRPPPQPATGNTPAMVKQDFTFTAKLASKVPIKSIYSPTHAVQIARKGESAAVVGLEQMGGAVLRDLDLYYAVSEKDIGLSLLTFKKDDEAGYFMALVAPKQEHQKSEIFGKRVTLVIDTSGSMSGQKMQNARQALKYVLGRLSGDDQFNVVRFSSDVEALFPSPQVANQENLKKAQNFVASMEALGATALDEAMTRALADGAGKNDKRAPHIVIFITDGEPTVGETSEQEIAKNAKRANKANSRVFTFGVGTELNARLLDRLAAEAGGASEYVKGDADFEAKVGGFYDKLAHPVLSDVSVALGDIGAYDIYPRKLPDLFKGSQLTVLGRYRSPGDSKVKLAGYMSGEAKSYEYGATFPEKATGSDFIPRLWAVRKVGYLLEEIRLHGEKAEMKDEVITLGKRFGIVTPYTSYLVVEDTGRVQGTPPPMPRREDFNDPVLGARNRGGFAPQASKGAAGMPVAEPPAMARSEAFASSGGESGVQVAREMKKMKEQERDEGDGASRSVGGKTFLPRGGGWVDTEIGDAKPKMLKVKYLSAAYFALVRARPELKGALTLGDRVTVLVAKGKAVEIVPDGGEEKAEAVESFLK